MRSPFFSFRDGDRGHGLEKKRERLTANDYPPLRFGKLHSQKTPSFRQTIYMFLNLGQTNQT